MIETFAHQASKSHGIEVWSKRLTTPKSSLRSPAQTRIVRNDGIA